MNRAKTIISISLFSIIIILLFTWSIYQVPNQTQDIQIQTIDINNLWLLEEGKFSFTLLAANPLDRRLHVMALFILAIGITSGLLITYLLYLQKQSLIQMASRMGYKGKDLQQFSEYLKKQQSRHLIDYQRLQTYLSHEQKNVLAILKTELEQGQQHQLAQKIDRLAQNMDDVLTLSDSIENSEKVEVDIALITAMASDAYRGIYPNINFTFDEEADLTILGRERWIHRAISNVLDNGIKYGNKQPIDISVTRKHQTVIVSVRDYGVGMEGAVLDKIFNPHFRINDLHQDGYGIGLSLVSHVCDLCEGVVWVDSEKGKGSTFYLAFPAFSVKLDT